MFVCTPSRGKKKLGCGNSRHDVTHFFQHACMDAPPKPVRMTHGSDGMGEVSKSTGRSWRREVGKLRSEGHANSRPSCSLYSARAKIFVQLLTIASATQDKQPKQPAQQPGRKMSDHQQQHIVDIHTPPTPTQGCWTDSRHQRRNSHVTRTSCIHLPVWRESRRDGEGWWRRESTRFTPWGVGIPAFSAPAC